MQSTVSALPTTQSCSGAQANSPWGSLLTGFNNLSWASSTTCNITNMALSAQASATTNITDTNTTSQTNAIVTTFNCCPTESQGGCNAGDCNGGSTLTIEGNSYGQTNTVDMETTQLAFSSTIAQQQLMAKAGQSATSTTNGLTIFPDSSTATNIMNGVYMLSMSINTDIANICNTTSNNTIDMEANGYNNVQILNNTYDQTNNSSSKCTQTAISSSSMAQSISVTLGQLGSATTSGIALWIFLLVIIVIIAGFILLMGGVEYATFKAGGSIGWIAVLILGIMTIVFFATFYISPPKVETMSCAPSTLISNSTGTTINGTQTNNPYTLPGKSAIYNTSSDALTAFNKNDNYKAMDWVPNQSGNDGTATFYEGPYFIPDSSDGTSLYCNDITDSSTGGSNSFVSFRNPAYVNGSQNVIGKTGPGDVYLNISTGTLLFCLPPIIGTGKTASIGTGDPVYQYPSVLNSNSESNVFKGSIDSKIQTLPSGSSVYFWIPSTITTTQVPDMTNSVPNGDGTFTIVLTGVNYPPDDCCGTGVYGVIGDTKNAGNSDGYTIGWYEKNQKSVNYEAVDNDYFLVAFPQGIDDTAAGTLETYVYSQRYLLYPAVKLSDGNYYPAISDATEGQLNFSGTFTTGGSSDTDTSILSKPGYSWTKPMNTINGMGLVLELAQYNTSAFKYEVPQNAWSLSAALICLICTIVTFVGMIIYTHYTKTSTTNETIVNQGQQLGQGQSGQGQANQAGTGQSISSMLAQLSPTKATQK